MAEDEPPPFDRDEALDDDMDEAFMDVDMDSEEFLGQVFPR